jgi:hypothetical protein
MQAADPPVLAGKRDLHGADDCEQQREDEIASGEPGDERSDEEQHLEPMHREARRLVGVEGTLAGAEDIGADQVDLHEDAEDDRNCKRHVSPTRAGPDHAQHSPGRSARAGR